MAGFDANGEGFAGNNVAAIGNSVQPHTGDQEQRGVDLLALAARAAE